LSGVTDSGVGGARWGFDVGNQPLLSSAYAGSPEKGSDLRRPRARWRWWTVVVIWSGRAPGREDDDWPYWFRLGTAYAVSILGFEECFVGLERPINISLQFLLKWRQFLYKMY